MARKKRINPLLIVARTYVSQHVPELKAAPLHLRMLDLLAGIAELCGDGRDLLGQRLPEWRIGVDRRERPVYGARLPAALRRAPLARPAW